MFSKIRGARKGGIETFREYAIISGGGLSVKYLTFGLHRNVATSGRRVWEIDFLRAAAIILMVVFHTVFDLSYFASAWINTDTGFWYWEGQASALLFIFISGISSGFSSNTVKRGLKVLAAAMLITIVTYIFFKSDYIRFGILHLLAAGMLLFPLLKKFNNIFLLFAAAVLAAAAIPLRSSTAVTSLLLPLGVRYAGFTSLDYYPLSPYLAVFILGIAAFKVYYYKRKSVFRFEFENKYIAFISRHSLAIYLIHQPVIIAVIFLLKFIMDISVK
jgi:uncharacterized membrane protein